MAVVKSKRGKSTLETYTKANALATYTIQICSNEKYFPKHYRWCITSKIVDAAIEIANNITKANSITVKVCEEYTLRRVYQDKALAATYALLSMMDIAYRTFGIEANRIEHWTGLVIEVQNLLRSWKHSDEQRYKEYWVDGCKNV